MILRLRQQLRDRMDLALSLCSIRTAATDSDWKIQAMKRSPKSRGSGSMRTSILFNFRTKKSSMLPGISTTKITEFRATAPKSKTMMIEIQNTTQLTFRKRCNWPMKDEPKLDRSY